MDGAYRAIDQSARELTVACSACGGVTRTPDEETLFAHGWRRVEGGHRLLCANCLASVNGTRTGRRLAKRLARKAKGRVVL